MGAVESVSVPTTRLSFPPLLTCHMPPTYHGSPRTANERAPIPCGMGARTLETHQTANNHPQPPTNKEDAHPNDDEGCSKDMGSYPSLISFTFHYLAFVSHDSLPYLSVVVM